MSWKTPQGVDGGADEASPDFGGSGCDAETVATRTFPSSYPVTRIRDPFGMNSSARAVKSSAPTFATPSLPGTRSVAARPVMFTIRLGSMSFGWASSACRMRVR